MILRGILDNSLSGQLCIRGFAYIKDLERISKADYTYQRNPIEGREDIVDFLDNENYLFFPEIILGYKFKHSFDNSKDKEFPLQAIQSSSKYISPVDGVKVAIKSTSYKDKFDSRNSDTIKIIELDIPQSVVEEKLFHRIDGNHRLKAAEESTSSKVDSMVAPFCIILGQEIYQNGALQEDENLDTFNKSIKVFFHNINTKTIPLKSEENLKVLLDDEKYFPDEELQEILGQAGLYARQLFKKADPEYFTNIAHILHHNYRTYYLDIFSKLIENDFEEEGLVDKVFESLKSIDQLYKDHELLKTNTCLGLLTAFLYYHIKGESIIFERFKSWVTKNHIYEIDEIKAESIIKIFDKIAQQEIKVFVAMPYFEGDADIVAEYNTIYNDAIKKISDKHGIGISLYPIMQNKGETQDQIQDIINKIKSCTIFFADISGNNANVLYEMGWARALNKHVVLVREKDSDKPKSDYSNDTYHTYKNSARSKTLSKIVHDNIIEILTQNFGLIIKED